MDHVQNFLGVCFLLIAMLCMAASVSNARVHPEYQVKRFTPITAAFAAVCLVIGVAAILIQ